MRKSIPSHIEGLLRYLRHPNEKANEDLAIGFFRQEFGPAFTRQADAKRSDGHVPGLFVLELKGATSQWLSGLLQGLAYRRELTFSVVVVAAKQFLAAWRVDDLPEGVLSEVEAIDRAPSTIGRTLALKYRDDAGAILKLAAWSLSPAVAVGQGLFAGDPQLVHSEFEALLSLLKNSVPVRRTVTPANFTSVLSQMKEHFDPQWPLKAVRAFYSIVFGWDSTARVELSKRSADQVSVSGEVITHLQPSKRMDFKRLVESHEVLLKDGENFDDFFARYDQALDVVDPAFRKRNGIFFTDLALSKFAMWFAKSALGDIGKNHLVIDPACGSGNLVTNWRAPLELRHKVVSEIEPELLFAVERRMKGDAWHDGKFTVVPKVSEGQGLNFLDKSATEYLAVLKQHLLEKGHRPDRPLAFLCNPPYRSDDDQGSGSIPYAVHPTVTNLTGNDAASERYCCFLAQMKLICDEAEASGLPGDSLLLLFTKAIWLTDRPIFRAIRAEMLGSFEDVGGVIVDAREFFDVSGAFPVAFTLWRYRGANAGLDCSRPVVLTDLTWVKQKLLHDIRWDDPVARDEACQAIFQNEASAKVSFGEARMCIRAWTGQTMIDFKRSRRRHEQSARNVGGLPLGDHRDGNTKAYGEADGIAVGFMDDLTPCRIKGTPESVPWFRLNKQFMDCKKNRCMSGPPTHFGFAARDAESAEKLFFWFALARTFMTISYPMWADPLELWAPNVPSTLSEKVRQLTYAIGLADNECVETRFPANNPRSGVPEARISNPLNPASKSSFWSTTMASAFATSESPEAMAVLAAVGDLYTLWAREFRHQPDLPIQYQRPYFIDQPVLAKGSGIVQIAHYAHETNHAALGVAYKRVQETLKQAKRAFWSLLMSSDGLNYFGDKRSARPVVVDNVEGTLAKRVAVAAFFVNGIGEESSFGRTKLAKLIYIADMVGGLDLKMDYTREAAGPLDIRALYDAANGIEALAARQDAFSTSKRMTRRGEMVRYKVGSKISVALTPMKSFPKKAREEIERISSLFQRLTVDQCEIVATLFACWNDLVLDGEEASPDRIVVEFRERWHARKQRFSGARLGKALDWMKEHRVVPPGSGKRTSVRARAR